MEIETEKRVLRHMVEIYCRNNHGRKTGLCDECADLLDYAFARLDHCPKGDRKGSCRRCTIHCYSPARRQQIRAVMRHSGPRMFPLHPILSLRHLIQK